MTVSYSLKAVHGRRLDTIIFLWYSGEDASHENSEQVVVHLTRKQATHFGMILHARADFRSEWGRGRLESWNSRLLRTHRRTAGSGSNRLLSAVAEKVRFRSGLCEEQISLSTQEGRPRRQVGDAGARQLRHQSKRPRILTKLEVLLPLKARPSPPDRRAFFFLEAIFGVSRSESMAFFALVRK